MSLFSDLEDTVREFSRRLRGLPRHSVQIALPKVQLGRYSVAPDLLDDSSVVYSARTTASAFFDEAMRTRFGCTVHTCDVSAAGSIVDRLQLMMRRFGHTHVDLLRFDLEGAEYAAIDALTRTKLRPCQLVVDFHHHLPELSVDQTERALTQLNQLGYRIFDCQASGYEYSLALV